MLVFIIEPSLAFSLTKTARRTELKNLQISRGKLEEDRLIRLRQVAALRKVEQASEPLKTSNRLEMVPDSSPRQSSNREDMQRLIDGLAGIDLADVLSDTSTSACRKFFLPSICFIDSL